ncbi:hypothetical protein ACFS6H_19810 [Terrimonas rubra]|uniref:Uncharacterized protein n=1 Tax=Terrimonas rubra TaxID=1035890 RepID=A0ABW6ABF0_9BACT
MTIKKSNKKETRSDAIRKAVQLHLETGEYKVPEFLKKKSHNAKIKTSEDGALVS